MFEMVCLQIFVQARAQNEFRLLRHLLHCLSETTHTRHCDGYEGTVNLPMDAFEGIHEFLDLIINLN